MSRRPEIVCPDIWLPGVCVSVSLHKLSLQGGYLHVGPEGGLASHADVGPFDYAESRFSGVKVLVSHIDPVKASAPGEDEPAQAGLCDAVLNLYKHLKFYKLFWRAPWAGGGFKRMPHPLR